MTGTMSGKFALSLLSLLVFSYSSLSLATVTLDGHSITPAQISSVAAGEPVAIAPAALARVKQANQVLIDAAQNGQKIYGLTVGVGLNKDRPMVDVHGRLCNMLVPCSALWIAAQ